MNVRHVCHNREKIWIGLRQSFRRRNFRNLWWRIICHRLVRILVGSLTRVIFNKLSNKTIRSIRNSRLYTNRNRSDRVNSSQKRINRLKIRLKRWMIHYIIRKAKYQNISKVSWENKPQIQAWFLTQIPSNSP
jgi:hypothetical protein